MSRKLKFEVEVDSANGVVNINQAGKSLLQLGSAGEAAGRKAGKSLGSLIRKSFELNQAIELVKKGFHFLSAGVMEFFNIGMGFESLELRFETVLQSAERGKEAFAWVKDFSSATPFRIEGLSESFLLLESFGIKGEQYMRTFGDAAAGLSIPIKDLSLVMGQIWSKPKAQAEEMLQLIERGVPVTRILSEQLGLTREQIGDIGREGIDGRKVFEALAKGMNQLYGGAMEKMAATGRGMLSTLQDKVQLFIGALAGGAMGSLKEKLEGIINKIDEWAADGTLEQVAKDIGDTIAGVVDSVSSVVKTLWEWRDTIIEVGKLWALYFAASKVQAWGKALNSAFSVSTDLVSTFASELKELPGFFRGLKKEGMGTGAALRTSFSTFGGSLKSAGASAKGLGAQIKKIPPAIGIAVALYGAQKAGQALAELFDKWSDVEQKEMEAINRAAEQADITTDRFRGMRDHLVETLNIPKSMFKQMSKDFSNIDDRVIRMNKIMQAIRNGKYGDEMAGQFAVWLKAQKKVHKDMLKLKNAEKEVGDEIDKATGLTKDQAKALESLSGKIGVLTKEGYKKLSNEVTAFIHLAATEFDQFERNQEGVGKSIEMIEAWIEEYKIAGHDIPAALQKVYDKLYSIYLLPLPEVKYKLSDYFDLKLDEFDLNKLNPLFDLNELGLNNTEPVEYQLKPPDMSWLTDLEKSLEHVSERMKVFFGTIHSVSTALQTLGVISGKTGKSIDSLLEGAGGIANAFGQGALALGDFTSGNILGGISNLGGAITSLVSGVGKLIGGISDLLGLGHDWEMWTDKVNTAGIALGEFEGKIAELAEELRDDSMSTYDASFRAFNQTLAEVINNMDISVDSFEGYASSVHNILAQYDDAISGRSAASITETLGNLGDSFEALINKQRELGGIYSAEMVNIINDVQSRGLNIASINKYIAEESAKGFDTYKSLKDSLDSSGIEAEINEITQAMLGMKTGSDEFLEAQEKLLEFQKGLIDIQNIQEIFGDSSIEMFEEMYKYQEKVEKNQLLVKAIQDWETSLISYTNIWKINSSNLDEYQTKFDGYTKTAKSEYDKLIEAGFEQNEALETLGPTLSRLAELQKAHGFAIDDSTQAMIDQAREQGYLSEQTQSDQQTTNQLLLLIAEKLGATIPGHLRELTGLVSKEVDQIVGHQGKWSDSLDNIKGGITDIGDDITALDDLWGEKVHGNTITASNALWAASLGTIQDEMGGIGRWITKIDRQDAWDSQTAQISTYTDRLEEIATLLGVTIPAEYDTLDKRHTYLMEILKGDLEELSTLWNHFSPESFNIVTPGMREDDTDKFRDLISIWTEYGDTIAADQEALKNFYDALAGLNVTPAMQASLQEFIDSIGASLEDLPTTLFEHFDPGRYNIVLPSMRAEDTDNFNELLSIYAEYGDIISADSEALQAFYDDLAGLNVTPEMQGSWETFLNSIGVSLDELNQATVDFHGLTLSLGDSFQLAGATFTNITSAMISDETALESYINNLKDQFEIEVPDSMTSMEDRWAFVMSSMGGDMSDFVVNANGQVLSLSQAIRQLGRDLTEQSGFTSQWGIYTDEEKQDMSVEFEGMRATWASHWQELLASPDNLDEFYKDMQGLVVTDDFQDKYNSFLDSIRVYNTHIQRGDTLDGGEWTPAPEEEGEEDDTPASRPRPSYTPRPSTTATATASGSIPTGESGGGGDTYEFNINMVIQGGTGKELVLEFIDHLRHNKWGLKTAVTKIAKEVAEDG